MIFSGLVYLSAYILQAITALLPSSDGFSPEVANAFTTMGGYVQILNTVLSITTLATGLTITFSVDNSIFGFKTIKWLISYVPLIGGKS